MFLLFAAAVLLASPEPLQSLSNGANRPAQPQAQTRTVSCNLTIGATLHQGDDCVLRRISADREELRGGALRLEIVYRSPDAQRRQVLLNGRPGSQSRLSGMEGVSGITETPGGPNSIAYQWWTRRAPAATPTPDPQEPSGW